MKLEKLRPIVAMVFFMSTGLSAQNGYNTGLNGTTINLSCNQNCLNIPLRVPHLKTSSDYTVAPISYNPYPYITTSGNEITSLYADDVYSEKISLPFAFCFYDSLFSNIVIGSNGVLTFDTANAGCQNAWAITQPIPFSGGTICTISSVYYPKASIMGAYSDLDPGITASPASKKIEWRVEGTAPFRRFIAGYYHIGVYGTACGLVTPNTFQIVLYESSGIIEVYFEQKACIAGSNGGRAILGIQNWNRNKAVTAPGKNNAVWNENNTAYRFMPVGGASRFVKSEIFTLGGTFIAQGDTATAAAGLLDVTFPGFCPVATTGKYVIKTTFSACDNPVNLLENNDTITINKTNNLNATATVTQTDCGLAGTGTATITVAAGTGTPPYTYVLNPGNITQPGNNIFNNLTAGNYTVTATDAGAGCTSTVPVTIISNGVLTVNFTATNTTCPGAANGSIIVNPPNGTAPITYSINGGIFSTNNLFSNLAAGTYFISVHDNAGCQANFISASVANGTATLSGTATATPTSCNGINDGKISVTPASGTGPYEYSINNGMNWQANNIFNGLAPGNYTILIREAGVCISNGIPVTVSAGVFLSGTATSISTACVGVDNGSITVIPGTGFTGPFEYSLDGNTFQTLNTFTGIAAGNHNVIIRNMAGCISANIPVTVAAGTTLTGVAASGSVSCNSVADGSITVTPGNGSGPYLYSLDGGVNQLSNIFNGIAAGLHSIVITDALGCISPPVSVTVTQPAVLAAPVPSVQPVTCNGQSTGVITVNPTGGTIPYSYSLDNINYQSANTFKVPQGIFTVYVRDANSCAIQFNNITITQPAVLNASIVSTTYATCNGGNDGTIEVAATGGTAGYQYSVNGTNFQSSNILNVKAGTYNVTIKDVNTCTSIIPNVVVGLTDNLTLSVTNPLPVCEGGNVQLRATGNAAAYSWAPATDLTNPAIANPAASPNMTTTYTVTGTLGNCSKTADVIVTVMAAPVPDAGPDGDICFGQDYQLQGSGGVSYNWTPATYLNNTTISNPQVIRPDRTTAYTLSVVDANNCSSLITDQVMVHVTPPIKVITSPVDTVVYTGAQFQLLATSGGTSYIWSPATRLNNPNVPDPVVTAGFAGDEIIYRVIATSSAGCQGEGYVTVKVYNGPDIYVANAFTPNNDSKNDVFIPFPVGIKQLNYFRVFNRWGQMVYSTTSLSQGWNGKMNGKEQPNGVYMWIVQGVTENGKIISKRGTVTLIR